MIKALCSTSCSLANRALLLDVQIALVLVAELGHLSRGQCAHLLLKLLVVDSLSITDAVVLKRAHSSLMLS